MYIIQYLFCNLFLMMLSSIFIELLNSYIPNKKIVEEWWTEIEKHYRSKHRYYHTLQHIENMYIQLLTIKEHISDWDTLLFSLFYHDIIYKATAKDNEEQSAELAKKRMQQMAYPREKIQLCVQQILATKSHIASANADTNFFTDADLSILGADWPEYEQYTKAIRKEYAIYPDLLYKPGRRKVLQHFLGMERIYKTEFFKKKYEAVARENMQKEMKML
jgi:predicted metal-dependent HD superfamily phosphohydrolase